MNGRPQQLQPDKHGAGASHGGAQGENFRVNSSAAAAAVVAAALPSVPCSGRHPACCTM